MSLRKSPARTPALLAANRANARNSTGPRSVQGKARVSLNALKHGGYAAGFERAIVQAGYRHAESHYQWFRSEIARAFAAGTLGGSGRPPRPADERQAEHFAVRAWCQAREAAEQLAPSGPNRAGSGTKPESPVSSMANGARPRVLSRIRIDDRWRRIGLVFWLQQRRYWTFESFLRELEGRRQGKSLEIGPPRSELEERWRRQKFRLRRPGLWERMELEERLGRARQQSRPSIP